MATAIDVVIGMAMSAPSMATMPSRADQRWAALFLTGLRLPHLSKAGKNTTRARRHAEVFRLVAALTDKCLPPRMEDATRAFDPHDDSERRHTEAEEAQRQR